VCHQRLTQSAAGNNPKTRTRPLPFRGRVTLPEPIRCLRFTDRHSGPANPKNTLPCRPSTALNGLVDVILIPSPRRGGKDVWPVYATKICARCCHGRAGGYSMNSTLPNATPTTPTIQAGVARLATMPFCRQVWLAECKRALPQGGRVGFLVWGDPSL